MGNEAFEALMQDITTRLQALDGLREMVSEERIKALINSSLDTLVKDETFVRKMRFGGDGAERKLVGTKYARWGLSIADIEFLYELQQSLRGQRRVDNTGAYSGPTEELENTFRAISEAFYLPQDKVREMDQAAIDNLFPRIPRSWFHGKDRELAAKGAFELTEAYQSAMRAMDSAESGYGSQLIGAGYVGELWEAARPASRVFGLIDSFEMRNPTEYLPVEADLPEMLYVSESTTYNASNYTTSKTGSQRVQVDAKKFVIHQMWSGELEEDSILPFVPYIRRQSQLSLAHYSDSLVLNGDTTNAATGNINLDDADPADTKHYLAFDGIRHAALVDVTANGVDQAGAVTFAGLLGLRSKMLQTAYQMDWGHPNDPSDLVYVADPETGDKICLLDEVVSVANFGQGATVLTGQVARIGQHPLVSSIAMSKTEADGKVSTTAANNTKGQVADFNRRGFKAGWRRRVKLESERLPATDQTRIVHSLRLGFGRYSPTGAASGIESAAVMYDISL
jgi:hypothetical protein